MTIAIVLLTLCYPFAIYFGMSHISTRYLALAIAGVFLLRLLILKHSSSAPLGIQSLSILATIIGLSVCALGIIFDNIIMTKLYPVLINLLFFGFFCYSLSHPPSAIERIARLTNPKLPPAAISYTLTTTIVWCGFFIINALIALWTAGFASTKIWMLYNGFIAYILIAILFSGEFLVRVLVKMRVKKKACS